MHPTLKTMFLTPALLLVASQAHAQLYLALDQPLQNATPGQTLAFSGTLTNLGSDILYLNADTFNVASGLTFDDTPFSNAPLSLGANETYTGTLFDVTLAVQATNGDYLGAFSIIGGVTPSSQDVLATTNFDVHAEGSSNVPAPGSLTVCALGAGLFLAKRKECRRLKKA